MSYWYEISKKIFSLINNFLYISFFVIITSWVWVVLVLAKLFDLFSLLIRNYLFVIVCVMIKSFLKHIVFYDKRYPAFAKSFLYKMWKKSAAWLAIRLYGNPAQDMFVIGITGTNGKTTTVNILHHLLQEHVGKTVSISTANVRIGDDMSHNSTKMSSLGPMALQRVLADAKHA